MNKSLQFSWQHQPWAQHVHHAGVEKLALYTNYTLMIVWPTPSLCTALIPELGKFKKIIFVGEPCNENGNRINQNANENFFHALKHSKLELTTTTKSVPNFPFMYGQLMTFGKGSTERPVPGLSNEDYIAKLRNLSIMAADYHIEQENFEFVLVKLDENLKHATKVLNGNKLSSFIADVKNRMVRTDIQSLTTTYALSLDLM